MGGCAVAVRAGPAGHWGGDGVSGEAEAAGEVRKHGREVGRVAGPGDRQRPGEPSGNLAGRGAGGGRKQKTGHEALCAIVL